MGDVADDDVVVTGVERSTKCPILQREMTATGDMRPMCTPCGHALSFFGACMYLGFDQSKPKFCPIAGCTNKHLVIGAIRDDTELAQRIKEKQSGGN